MKPAFAHKKVTDSVCKWANPQYTIYRFADISTQEVCRVTQKLDLDQVCERSIPILKETNMIKHFLLQILGLFASCDPVWTIGWYLWFVTSYGV